MSRDGWFRNVAWDDCIALEFEKKLGRARLKSQYLRIQACTLAPFRPEVALELLNRYFALGTAFDHAQAQCDRAVALTSLNRLDDAVQAYEAALARETGFPNFKTNAFVDLPFLIATRRLSKYYSRALELLELRETGMEFPITKFKRHASSSLIYANQGKLALAGTEARVALKVSNISIPV